MDIEGVLAISALFIGLPWLILHYITKWKSAASLTPEDENLLDDLHDTARRLEERLGTIERIMTAEQSRLSGGSDMTARRTKFYLDKQNAKWSGVCAGIADYSGLDVFWVRMGVVAVTVATFPMGLFAYWLIAWLATNKPVGLYDNAEDAKFWQGVRVSPTRSTRDVRAKFRDIDRRLADVETYYTSRNSTLASEIDALR